MMMFHKELSAYSYVTLAYVLDNLYVAVYLLNITSPYVSWIFSFVHNTPFIFGL